MITEIIENRKLTLPALFAQSLKSFGDRDAMALVGQKPKTYHEIHREVKALVAFLENIDIKPGDKIAILSNNTPNWAVAYYAITFMGAVAVPLLPEFLPAEIQNTLEHSGSKAIFVSENLYPKLKELHCPALKMQIRIEDFSLIESGEIPVCYNSDDIPVGEYNIEEDDLAAIIYTSGTMGTPKGVMLSHRNICFTAIKSGRIQPINEYDRFLSILPLSHSYENTIGLILPMLSGACVYFLGKLPTPSNLLPALLDVRPTIMLTVPLIIEKIYRGKILPAFQKKSIMRLLYSHPFFRKTLNSLAGRKLMKTFGGELKFFGIGGAKLDPVVEKFLIEARFPYAIGYGLTETAPLLAGANPQNTRLQSTGPAMEGVQLLINDPDPVTGEGEIWAKGPNVMLGYYKEPVLTSSMYSTDGWFKTGDLGAFDKDGFLYIKGRLKNLILGANGENIYPEEIETVINNFKYVVESLVFQQKGKLVAMVHFNRDEIELRFDNLKGEVTNFVERKIEELGKELQVYVNKRVNKISHIHVIVSQPDPFTKTATQKIKRFLYS
jgi:long-chain acyl-CoA synthetase